MGDMNFPDPNTTTEHDGWDWDSEKWTKWGSCGGNNPPGYLETKAIASGAMTTGEMVVVNADDTVSVVAETLIAGGGDIPQIIGSEVPILSNPSDLVSCCYDSDQGKVLAIHGSSSPSYSWATASVGTVSGDSISFGAPVLLRKDMSGNFNSEYHAIYDATLKKSIIAFVDQDIYPTKLKVVLATVSGDSVSFGSEMEVPVPPTTDVFKLVDLAYDQSSKKYVAILRVAGDFGTAMAFSVSDNSVTSDSPVVFKSESITEQSSISVNPDGGDLLFFYCMTSTQTGNATAGAVSGDTIQFGTELYIRGSVDIGSASYNQNGERHVLSYRTGGKGYAHLVKVDGIEAEKDGTQIQITGWSTSGINQFTESVYYPKTGKTVVGMLGAADYKTYLVGLAISETGVLTADEDRKLSDRSSINCIAMAYDPSAEMLTVIQGAQTGTYSVVYSPGGTVLDIIETNLTQDNFIGVAKGDYSDGSEATVQIAGINADQQGMTVGKQYIQPDGTLEITEGDPSVFAGTAISSTELNIKDTV